MTNCGQILDTGLSRITKIICCYDQIVINHDNGATLPVVQTFS